MIDLPFFFFVLTALSLIPIITLVFWSEINYLLRGKWLFYIITNTVLFHAYFSVRCDVLNSWKYDKPHSECKQIKIETTHNIALGKKRCHFYRSPRLEGWIPFSLSSVMLFTLQSHLKMCSAEVWCFRSISSSEASMCLSIVPVWTGASEPYPAFAETNGARPNCYK